MAATFVVEDGSGKTNSNSYVSVSDADDYNDNYLADAVWIAATTSAKELALRQGTQYLDAQYSARWIGTQKTQEQALDWPRVGAETLEGFVISDTVVPQQVSDATVEAAIRSINGTSLVPDTTASIKREKNKVGSLEQEIEYVGGKTATTNFVVINDLLNSLTLGGGGNNVPLYRG